MTTNDRIHEQAFSYDSALPPTVPAGQPLTTIRGTAAGSRPRRGAMRGPWVKAIATLRTRAGS